jgi:hypothetical protein
MHIEGWLTLKKHKVKPLKTQQMLRKITISVIKKGRYYPILLFNYVGSCTKRCKLSSSLWAFVHRCCYSTCLQLSSNDHVQKGTIDYNYPPINISKKK